MANKTECDIPSFWKNRKEYSLSQIAYIAAGLEPKEFEPYFPERYLPELVKRVCADIENIFKKNAPDATPYNLTEWNTIDFDRDRAIRLIQDIGGCNFLLVHESPAIPSNEPLTPEYLNQNHPMHSKELAIAIQAWTDVLKDNPPRPKKGTRKKLIRDWLDKRYPDKNDLSNEAKIRITIMLNPDSNGGVSPTE